MKPSKRITHAMMDWQEFEEESFAVERTEGLMPFNAKFTLYDFNSDHNCYEVVMDADEEPVLEFVSGSERCETITGCKYWALEKVKELQELAMMVAIYRSASK